MESNWPNKPLEVTPNPPLRSGSLHLSLGVIFLKNERKRWLHKSRYIMIIYLLMFSKLFFSSCNYLEDSKEPVVYVVGIGSNAEDFDNDENITVSGDEHVSNAVIFINGNTL